MLTMNERGPTASTAPPTTIRVYNTLSKVKEPLETVVPGRVSMYLCGPTVYKPSHIGHMVGPVIFDAVKRYLAYCGYQVTFVVNITDVDDKLIAESQRRGIAMSQVAAEMTADYHRNLEAMGIDTIDHFPKATENMDEIIRFTQQLVERGFAYVADGDVYFDVGKDPSYGKLSNRSLESLQGEGGGMAERKRSAGDFALWKSAKPDEPSWDSPWGSGRPGWHIECSAMSRRLLGETFDIHGGGLDLVFPHHENEIAQSECCHGKPMARYWMHNGLMQASNQVGKVGGRNTRDAELDAATQEAGKMGKSKGASAFSELRKQFEPETIRFFLLSTHYRRPIDYSEERINEVGAGLATFYRFFDRYKRITGEDYYQVAGVERRADGAIDDGGDELLQAVGQHRQKFLELMDDDFNTGGAIGELFQLVSALNRYIDAQKLEDPQHRANGTPQLVKLKTAVRTLRELSAVLGMFRRPVEAKAGSADDAFVGNLVKILIDERAEARKAKNFAAADRIRQRLKEIGVTLEDRPGGTDWTRG